MFNVVEADTGTVVNVEPLEDIETAKQFKWFCQQVQENYNLIIIEIK